LPVTRNTLLTKTTPIEQPTTKGYLDEVCRAVQDGVRVAGWLAWSFLDAWEWREGCVCVCVVCVCASHANAHTARARAAFWLARTITLHAADNEMRVPRRTHPRKTKRYTQRFGVVHVAYADGSLARSPKVSALWLSKHFFEGGAAKMG
jgi:hypothetical protein